MTLSSSRPGAPFSVDAPLAEVHEPEPHGREYLPLLGGAATGICIAVITPVLASLTYKLQHVTSDPAAATAQLGIVLGVGAVFALIANPLVGRLSDRTTSRFGMRRPWIVGGSVVGALALTGIGYATSPWLIGLFWFLAQGSFNASLAAVNATVADQVSLARRGRASGIVGLSIPVSIVTGTALVSVLPNDVLRFAVPGAVAVVLTSVFAWRLRDRVQTGRPVSSLRLRELVGSFVFHPRRNPDFAWTWLSKFLVMFGYTGITTFFPMYLQNRFGLAESAALPVIVVANLVLTLATLVSSPLAGWLSDRSGRRRPFVAIAGAVMVVGLVLLAFAPSLTVVFVAEAVIGLGIGSFNAADLALGSMVLPDPADTAKDLGILTAANSLPQSIAPAIAPAIIALGASTAVGGYSTWYLFGAVVALAGSFAIFRVRSVR